MPEFRLQFPIDRVSEYAGRYSYADDVVVIATGQTARERGYYTFEEFAAVCRWKSQRTVSYVAKNASDCVERATSVALGETTGERERISVLRGLQGVEWPTASVLLHLAYPERYPILDQRALQALGIRTTPTYSFRFWQAYVSAWLALVERAGVDGRTFDQALWQWSKEEGARLS